MSTDNSLEPKDPTKEILEKKISELYVKLNELKEKISRNNRYNLITTVVGLVCILSALPVYSITSKEENEVWLFSLIALGIFLLSLRFLISNSYNNEEAYILKNEIELLETNYAQSAFGAQRLLRNYQLELKRYYDQTLNHSSSIVLIGFLCLILGFIIIGYTLFLVSDDEKIGEWPEKTIIGVLGIASGMLVNYVAVVFLKMFTGIIESFKTFHERLVGTHNLYFNHYIAEKISRKNRDNVFEKMISNFENSKSEVDTNSQL